MDRCTHRTGPTPSPGRWHWAQQYATGGSLRDEIFFFCEGPPLRTAPRDHQPPTANTHQPPTATSRQPPTATNRQRRPTANCQPLPTATNRQPPTVAMGLMSGGCQNCCDGHAHGRGRTVPAAPSAPLRVHLIFGAWLFLSDGVRWLCSGPRDFLQQLPQWSRWLCGRRQNCEAGPAVVPEIVAVVCRRLPQFLWWSCCSRRNCSVAVVVVAAAAGCRRRCCCRPRRAT